MVVCGANGRRGGGDAFRLRGLRMRFVVFFFVVSVFVVVVVVECFVVDFLLLLRGCSPFTATEFPSTREKNTCTTSDYKRLPSEMLRSSAGTTTITSSEPLREQIRSE